MVASSTLGENGDAGLGPATRYTRRAIMVAFNGARGDRSRALDFAVLDISVGIAGIIGHAFFDVGVEFGSGLVPRLLWSHGGRRRPQRDDAHRTASAIQEQPIPPVDGFVHRCCAVPYGLIDVAPASHAHAAPALNRIHDQRGPLRLLIGQDLSATICTKPLVQIFHRPDAARADRGGSAINAASVLSRL
jgi:hypothetical protein